MINMKQTLEEAAREAIHAHYNCNGKYHCEQRDYCEHCNGHNTAFDCNECGADEFKLGFIDGAEWQLKQSPWISVEEQLPPVGVDVIHTNIDTGRIYYGPINKVGALILGYTPYGEITATHYMVVPKFPFDEILKSEQRCDGTN